MILTKLTMKNFKKYREKEIFFQEGLTGIIGKNGSGKSTIFDGILYALYGEIKSGKKENLKNVFVDNKENLFVELCFEIEDKEYRVVRELRGKSLTPKAYFYENEELVSSSMIEVTKTIVEYIKMSKEAFIHTIFASQKELVSLSVLKPEERKKMVRKLLGFEKIDKVEKKLFEIIKNLKKEIKLKKEDLLNKETREEKEKEIKKFQNKISELNKIKNKKIKELSILEEEFKVLKKELDEIRAQKEQYQKVSSKIDLIQNGIENKNKQLEKMGNELENLVSKKLNFKIKKDYLDLNKLNEKQNFLKESYLKKDGLKKELKQLKIQTDKYKEKIDFKLEKIEQLDKLIEEREKVDNLIKSLKEKKVDLEKEKQIKSNEISAEKRVVKDTNLKRVKLQKLGKNSRCPTCMRELNDEYELVIDSLSKIIDEAQTKIVKQLEIELKKIKEEIDKVDFELDKYKTEEIKLNSEIVILENYEKELEEEKIEFQNSLKIYEIKNKELKKIDEIEYDENNHKKIKEDLAKLKPKYDEFLEIEIELKRKPKIEKEMEVISSQLRIEEKELIEMKKILESIDYSTQKEIDKIKQVSVLEADIKSLNNEIYSVSLELENNKGRMGNLAVLLEIDDKKSEKINLLQNSLEDYEVIKNSLSDFKTKLNSQITPRISFFASELFGNITKGKYQQIEVDDDFNFYIYDEKDKYPIERFSGGEIDLANLVLRIAISKTLNEINGSNNISFLAFDEVFGSQDETRRNEIIEAFNTIKERYRQIFLISHEIDIKERFEKVIEL